MPKNIYTIQFFSSKSEKPVVVSVTHQRFKWLLGAASALIAILVALIIYSLPRAIQYETLKKENEQLISERLKVAEMLQDYNRIKMMDKYIRSVLGADLVLPSDSIISNQPFLTPAPEEFKYQKLSFLENIPIYPPLEGLITRGFIKDRIMIHENHYGIDIVAPEGTPVKAAASGVVLFSNWTAEHGYMVIIYHSSGYFTLYAHNQRNIVSEHQYVQRGEVIAFLGNTGKSEGPHLHFEIWHQGAPVDPQQLIYSYRSSDISLKSEGGD